MNSGSGECDLGYSTIVAIPFNYQEEELTYTTKADAWPPLKQFIGMPLK